MLKLQPSTWVCLYYWKYSITNTHGPGYVFKLTGPDYVFKLTEPDYVLKLIRPGYVFKLAGPYYVLKVIGSYYVLKLIGPDYVLKLIRLGYILNLDPGLGSMFLNSRLRPWYVFKLQPETWTYSQSIRSIVARGFLFPMFNGSTVSLEDVYCHVFFLTRPGYVFKLQTGPGYVSELDYDLAMSLNWIRDHCSRVIVPRCPVHLKTWVMS